ncbi:MAG: FAD-dependent oxidoreductase [Candidatus Omnitrophica bacterium]|nr:FAD-dependent oxidoreductase [Candidatus Omnitrophota bacterium]
MGERVVLSPQGLLGKTIPKEAATRVRIVVADDSTGALNVALGMMKTSGENAMVLYDPEALTTIRDHAIVIDSKAGTFSENEAQEHNHAIRETLSRSGKLPDIKIDYALRNLRNALSGFYGGFDYDLMFFVPAMPRLGTKTEQGTHFILEDKQWVEVHQTDKAQQSRRKITTSNLREFIRLELGVPEEQILLVPFAVVSEGPQAISAFIENQNLPKGTVVIPDILNNDHLGFVAQAVHQMEDGTLGKKREILRVGASDFLRALMVPDPDHTPRLELPFAPLQRKGSSLALIGTTNPMTTQQIEIAREKIGSNLLILELNVGSVFRGGVELKKEVSRLRREMIKALKMNRPMILQTERKQREVSQDQAHAIAQALSEVVRQREILSKITAFFVSGGETLGALSEITSASGVEIAGEFSERIPWGTFYGGEADGIPVISKQGGHDLDPDILHRFFKAAQTPNKKTFSYRDVIRQWEWIRNHEGYIYDTVVVGGGAAGAGVIRDLATRGNVSAVLVERDDFAAGASSKSGKAIHPGVWYLRMAWHHLLLSLKLRNDPELQLSFWENMSAFWDNLQLVWGGTRERKLLVETTNGTVEPLPHLALVYQDSPDKKWEVFLGLRIYEIFSWFHRGKYGKMKIYHNAEQVKKELPFVGEKGLVGAVRYWDAKTNNDKALVLRTIRDACYRSTDEYPIFALHHFDFRHYQWREPADGGKGYFEITLLDRSSKEEIVIKARTITNAAGAWIDEVHRKTDEPVEKDLVKFGGGSQVEATNAFINEQLSQDKNNAFRTALAPLRKERRYFFRWYHENGVWFVRMGSTDRKDKRPGDIRPTEDEVRELVTAYNKTVSDPRWQISEKDIYHADSGIRPLVKPKEEGIGLGNLSRAFKIIETQQGEGKVFHMLGVKLTEMRWAGYELGNRLSRELRREKPARRIGKSRTNRTPFLRVEGEESYRINYENYNKDNDEYLRRRIKYLVNYEMLAHFADYMFHYGGLRDSMRFDEKGKPGLNVEKMRFLHGVLGDLLNWNLYEREEEWQKFWSSYERNMAAVKALAADEPVFSLTEEFL